MVLLSTYKTFWEYIATVISCSTVMLVSDEAELQKKIRDVADREKILVAVIPSTDIFALDRDNYSEIDSCFAFILIKSDAGSLSEAELLAERQQTQAMMIAAKTEMLRLTDDFTPGHPDANTHLMRHLVEGKIHTDPEYNYLGCNGWSISFALRTRGIDNQNF